MAAKQRKSVEIREEASQAAWRLLHVEGDEVDAMKLKLALRSKLPAGTKIDDVSDLSEAAQRLADERYDALLVGVALTGDRSVGALQRLIAEQADTPVLILSGDDDANAALLAGRCGANEFLFKSRLTGESLVEALRKAIGGTEKTTADGFVDRRPEPRYDITASAVIFPVLPDGRPGREIAAMTVNISLGGIGLLAEQDSDTVPDVCLVGVECRDGVYRHATVEWRQRRLALPAIHFGGRFLRRADDPFHASKLTPRFDAASLRFKPAMDAAVLQEWTARGVLRQVAIDRVKVCSKCESLPTFRSGCPRCGSAKAEVTQLVHHFACAHVAPVSEFEQDGLVCPKCLAQNLVVGADFEYLDGPWRCVECPWSDSETALIAECMKCGHRCAGSETIEKDVLEYHVQRLDPLALLENAD